MNRQAWSIISEADAEPDDPTRAAIADVLAATRACVERLAPYIQALTDDERAALPPVPNRFAAAVPSMLEALTHQHALLALFPELDLDRVGEDLARVTALAVLENRLEQLLRTVHDSGRMHEARAFSDLLPVYRVAQVRVEQDTTLRPVTEPLRKVFVARRAGKKKKKED